MSESLEPPQKPLLCLPGPENWYSYAGDFCMGGQPIRLVQEGGQGRGTGWCVWDGAVVLSKYMEAERALQRTPQDSISTAHGTLQHVTKCIELGAGTGLAGLAAAQIFQVPTMLTDIVEVQEALQHNIALNPQLSSLVSAHVLDWHSPNEFVKAHQCASRSACTQPSDAVCSPCIQLTGQPANDISDLRTGQQSATDSPTVPSQRDSSLEFTAGGEENRVNAQGCIVPSAAGQDTLYSGNEKLLVLAADCVWVEELVHPFVQALTAVCGLHDDVVVLFAHKERSRRVDDVMMSAIQTNFCVESVPELPGESRGSISIMRLVLKARHYD